MILLVGSCFLAFFLGAWIFYSAGEIYGRVTEYEKWFKIFEMYGVNEWAAVESCEERISQGGEKSVLNVDDNCGCYVSKTKDKTRFADNTKEMLKCAVCSRFDDCMNSMDSASPMPIKCIIDNYKFFEIEKKGKL